MALAQIVKRIRRFFGGSSNFNEGIRVVVNTEKLEQRVDGVDTIGFLRNVSRIVRHSHEHWDGSGYPDALVGEAIPIESRVVFACDAFDAMTSKRTYQAAMSLERAVARLRELRGVHFDPEVVDALIAVVEEEVDVREPVDAAR